MRPSSSTERQTGMIIGYARVSTEEQKLDLQLQALEAAGCERIFSDQGQPGFHFKRDGLDAALEQLREGDTLVVWRLDRLGRSLSALVSLMDHLGRRGVSFRSLMENIATDSSGGRLMFHMMAALAEFERSVISERTRAGMAAARVRGAKLGRPKLLNQDQLSHALCLINCQKHVPEQVAKKLNVSTRTLKRYVAAMRDSAPPCGEEMHVRPICLGEPCASQTTSALSNLGFP